jgi:hypothetical protein
MRTASGSAGWRVPSLALDDAALRCRMRDTVEGHAQMAADIRAAAAGVIRGPPADVLELERLAVLESPVIVDRLVE